MDESAQRQRSIRAAEAEAEADRLASAPQGVRGLNCRKHPYERGKTSGEDGGECATPEIPPLRRECAG